MNDLVNAAVGLPLGSSIILKDDEGFLVPVTAHLAEGLEYTVVEVPCLPGRRRKSEVLVGEEQTMSVTKSLLHGPTDHDLREPFIGQREREEGHPTSSSPADPPLGLSIEDRLTKFERMSSHLANERTFLAWVRTTMSVAGLAVTYSSLSPHHNPAIFWSGSSFAWAVGLAVFCVGVSRYHTVKEVLNLPKHEITNRFGRRGIMLVVLLLGAFLALMTAIYLSSLYSDTH
jgi:putative membrane protein